MPVLNENQDAANSTSTTASMNPGDYFFGSLETTGDSDWIEVTLVAGQTYTFATVGVGALSDSLSDPLIRLRDANGVQVAEDDDGGPGRTSSITFTATTSGTYYLDVQSWNNTQAGDYGVSMVEGDLASFDLTMGAGILIRDDRSWSSTPETGATITWAIRSTGENPTAENPQGSDPSGGNPFVAPSAAQVAAIEDVMDYAESITGLTLNQVNPGGTSDNATILFGSYSANDGSGAYAYYPGNTSASSNAGDVWLNNNAGSTTNLPIGSYSYFVILHELGHALGLAHPGDYNASPGVSITYSTHAQFIEDSHQYSVMSYFDERNTTTSVGGYPDTFMLFDYLALHQLYGADMSYHSGNTIYGFNATEGGAYDFTVNTNPLMTIWDGNGNDTLDLSGWSMAQTITLKDGEFSSVGGYSENLSIAYGAVIENAIGGGGNDTMIGNDVGNSMSGGGGMDTINGHDGNDSLFGNQADDVLEGESGDDWAHGGKNNDTLHGGDGEDTLNGGKDDDWIYGNQGDDHLIGHDGNDWIHGGRDNDSLEGGAGMDTLNGGKNDDTLWGNDGEDELQGAVGNDFLYGNTENDLLQGGDDNDWMHGGKDDDTLEGGTGMDTVIGGKGNDTLNGGADADEFHFRPTWGADVIQDFQDNVDTIVLQNTTATNAAEAMGFASQQGSDVVFDFGNGDTLTVENVQLSALEDDLLVL